MNCCICNEKIGTQTNGWDKGHNAEPLVEGGRCCETCNSTKVIPHRMSLIRNRNKDKVDK